MSRRPVTSSDGPSRPIPDLGEELVVDIKVIADTQNKLRLFMIDCMSAVRVLSHVVGR